MAKKYGASTARKAKGGLSVKRQGKMPKGTARGVMADPEPKSMYSIKASGKGKKGG